MNVIARLRRRRAMRRKTRGLAPHLSHMSTCPLVAWRMSDRWFVDLRGKFPLFGISTWRRLQGAKRARVAQ